MGRFVTRRQEILILDYKLTDIDAWENGEYKEFAGNGMCFADLKIMI